MTTVSDLLRMNVDGYEFTLVLADGREVRVQLSGQHMRAIRNMTPAEMLREFAGVLGESMTVAGIGHVRGAVRA